MIGFMQLVFLSMHSYSPVNIYFYQFSLHTLTMCPNKLQILLCYNSIYFVCLADCCFPINIDWVKSDHEFLDKDALDSLSR